MRGLPLLFALLTLAACRPTPAPPADPSAQTSPEPLPTAQAPPTPDPEETVAPVAAAPDSPEAAAEVVREYYAAIDARDFRQAYALWGDDGQASGQSYEDFVDGFARTAGVSADVGTPDDPQGAAGSLYVSVPVTVHARTTGGGAQTFTGSYVLRRVNDVPGATPDQLRWHLSSANLTAAP